MDFERTDGTTYKKKVLVDQRQIVFYSDKYAVRSRTLREAALLKAKKIIENPSAYTRATSHGTLKYVMNVEVDKESGELKPMPNGMPCFDIDAIMEEEKYDGYYAIVTNVFDAGADKGKFGDGVIIDLYTGRPAEPAQNLLKRDVEDAIPYKFVFMHTPDFEIHPVRIIPQKSGLSSI